MVEFRGQVETARIQLNRVHEMRHRIAAIEYDIQEYRRLVEPLALKYGIPLRTTNAGQIAIAADKLIERYDTARKEVERRDIAQEDAENARQQLQHRERRLKRPKRCLGTSWRLVVRLIQRSSGVEPLNIPNAKGLNVSAMNTLCISNA